MQITIEGERGEGKSTLAILLTVILRRLGAHIVERIEENVPRDTEKRHDIEEYRVSKGLLGVEMGRLRPWDIKIIVKNPPTEEKS